MHIQFNTDKTINGDERNEDYFIALISEELDKYSSLITRIEVHLSDENGTKEGINDMRCLLEARIEGKQPIAVKNQADKLEYAVSGAITKLKAALKTIVERSRNH